MKIGYDIPFIDLSKDKDRQVLVDKEEGVYLGHPSTVLMDDKKTMYVVYPKGHGVGAIVLKKSEDSGLTWSERLETPVSWNNSEETPIIYKIKKPNGISRIEMISECQEVWKRDLEHPIQMTMEKHGVNLNIIFLQVNMEE